MKPLSRVVWHEGMHLAQHHFQAQNRYFEDSIGFALGQLFYRPYGVAGLEFDQEALRNGTVSLVHARGTLPDGLAFNFPESDPLPAPLEIRELFSPTVESQTLLLTVPAYRPGRANTLVGSQRPEGDPRFISETTPVRDDITGQDEKPVPLARKNFKLALDQGQADESVVAMPLARVRRDGTGHFVYDERYIPPCLQIGASRELMALLKRIVEILDGKSAAMTARRQQEQKSVADYAASEVADFWLTHTVHSGLAPLRHHLTARRSRPEQLYVELSRLAGSLCTFSLDSHPRNLPLYDHDHLFETFGALEKHIRAHLEVIVPTSYVSIPLAPQGDAFYFGTVNDKRCFDTSRWFLCIKANMGEGDLIANVPGLVKVCSQKYVSRLVKEALPGLTLEHTPSVPAAISPRIGTQYFRIQQAGPCWEAMKKANDVGVYVPQAFPNAEVEIRVQTQEGR
ncbi:MAG TPA: type VI secretion system baseplate subunit TssK [Opitutaceae bacterium]|nr:type VI secretion system baseplate subunit TssK [Opitutaceae bacterium]